MDCQDTPAGLLLVHCSLWKMPDVEACVLACTWMHFSSLLSVLLLPSSYDLQFFVCFFFLFTSQPNQQDPWDQLLLFVCWVLDKQQHTGILPQYNLSDNKKITHVIKSKQVWLTVLFSAHLLLGYPLQAYLHANFNSHGHPFSWHNMESPCFFTCFFTFPVTSYLKQQVIASPATKTLIRYHLQLGPSRYLSALSTPNHLCIHTCTLWYSSHFPNICFCFWKPITFPLHTVTSNPSTFLVPKWLRQNLWKWGKQEC